jgi:4-hydroxy-tetrahydrodipicolinate synthase
MLPLTKSSKASKTSRRAFLKASTAVAGAAMGGRLAAGRLACAADGKKAATASRGCPPEIRAALGGPWPSIRTPFTRQGEIDFDALRRHLDFMVEDAKAKAVVLTWGDSLYSLLTDEEIAQVTKVVVQHVDRRAFVVAADNSWWTAKTVEFAEYCVQVGADMLMVMPPDWAHSTTVDSLVAHYRAVSEQIPVMLVTNYLGRRGETFGLEVIKRLRDEVPGVMALKDDVGGAFIRKVCLLTHDRWALSAGGQKQNHMNMYPYGVGGYLSTCMTFKPEIAWRYWNGIQQGDLDVARAVIRDYDMPMFEYLIASEGSFDAAIHGIFELFGLAKRYRRPPYHSLTDDQMRDLADFLSRRGFL